MVNENVSIEDEFSDIENTAVPAVEQKATSSNKGEEEELSFDDFEKAEYIPAPEVGKFVEFTVDKIVKNPKTKGINKTTNEEFTIGVKKKDGSEIRLDVITTEGKRFTLGSWGLFYLFRGKDSLFAEEVRKRGQISGIKVRITRHYDGSVPNKKTSDIMKLYDLKTAQEAEAYKKEVATAQKEGRLVSMEILPQ